MTRAHFAQETGHDDPTLDPATEQPTRFRYLGTLEVWHDGRLCEIRGTIQRTLLAALLAAGSRPVSTQALVGELWADNPPATAENSLQAHVSRLRRKLHGSGDGRSTCLLSLPSGYQLLVADTDVDATTFARAVTEARQREGSDPDEAVRRLRSALTLWRGPVFGGQIGGPLCQAAAARYEASRTMAVELLFDLELRRGRHSEMIPELSELVESPSLNERVCEQLMVALYRSGRQIEALDVFRRMRVRLDRDLGVEPSPTLRKYEQAILTHHALLRYGEDHAGLRD